MRIALFHTTLPEPGRKPGGVEVLVHRLANALVRTGEHTVTVFSLTGAPADAAYSHRRLFPRMPWLASNLIARWVVLPFLLNFVRFGSHEVVHLHGDDWFFIARRLPTVRTMHGSALNEGRAAQTIKRRVTQYLLYPMEHLSVRLATIAAAVGQRTAEIYGIQEILRNGVDLQRFRPGAKSATPRVLYVGTWGGRKRGAWAHEIFTQRVVADVPGAELVFVSDRSRDHPSVINVSFPDDETLAGLYRESWVFAYPSLYEGFGLPYVEALASGVAIVTSDNEGAREVLESGRHGVVANDDAFASQVVELLRDTERRRSLETGGLRRARDFSWDIVTDRHLDVYGKAIARWST